MCCHFLLQVGNELDAVSSEEPGQRKGAGNRGNVGFRVRGDADDGYTDFTVGLDGVDGWWDKGPVGAPLSQA